MSFPSRGRARASRPRGSEEEYVLFLQGIPARCRWQELKDLVRQTALHIRQAVVYDDHHGFPTGLGQIIVKEEDEAWRTYHRLSTNGWEGQSLVVTLALTSSPTQPIAGPTKSPPCVIQPGYVAGYSTPRMSRNVAIPPSPILTEPAVPSSPSYHSTDYGSVSNLPFVSQQLFMPVFADPLCQQIPAVPSSPTLQPSFYDPVAFGMMSPYAMSHQMHQPVIANTLRPSYLNPTPRKSLYSYHNPLPPSYPHHNIRRSIIIHNLNPETTDQDLHAYLQETVTVEHCKVLPMQTGVDAPPFRTTATARVTLRSADEAKRAVALYNNTFFMHFRIRVKIDKSIPHYMAHSYAPEQYGSYQDTSEIREAQHPTPPTTEGSSSDSDELTHSGEASDCSSMEKPDPKSKPTISCQPLVVNGSGIGGRTAVAV
ncbi:hypothetical protein BDV18DRAFT_59780 [Aspergillus unguis]